MKRSWMTVLALGLAVAGNAQLAPPNDAGVSMGHVHINTKNADAQRKFWVDVLGAQEAKVGTIQFFKLPGVHVMLNSKDPSGGTEGSVVNHIAVKVHDLSSVLNKLESEHIPIVTHTPPQAMVLAPDDIRVELTEDPAIQASAVNHHIHFYTPDVDGMKKWYVTTFGAIPGKRGRFEAADLPGVNLSFTASTTAVAGTKGRALDHIGFEVRDLEAFTKKLEAAGVKFDIPYRKIPALGIALAFFTDPWGTYIELTEGLDKI